MLFSFLKITNIFIFLIENIKASLISYRAPTASEQQAQNSAKKEETQ